jgi:hypothetical protein
LLKAYLSYRPTNIAIEDLSGIVMAFEARKIIVIRQGDSFKKMMGSAKILQYFDG